MLRCLYLTASALAILPRVQSEVSIICCTKGRMAQNHFILLIRPSLEVPRNPNAVAYRCTPSFGGHGWERHLIIQ